MTHRIGLVNLWANLRSQEEQPLLWDPALLPPGGIEAQQWNLARYLAQAGEEVHVITGTSRGIQPAVEIDGVIFHPTEPMDRRIWERLLVLQAEVYLTSHFNNGAHLLALLALARKCHFVFRIPAHQLNPLFREPASPQGQELRDEILSTSHLVAITETQRELLFARFHLAATYLPNHWPATTPSAHTDRTYVLWVGNFMRCKRPERLLWLVRNLPHVPFHVVGGPVRHDPAIFQEYRDKLYQCPNVTFLGALPLGDTEREFRKASILLCTSEDEGFPSTFLQAWNAAIPVITTVDVDGMIARHGAGCLCRTDPELKDAIQDLWDHPEKRVQLGDQARKLFGERFTADQILPEYHRFFRALAAIPPGNRFLEITPPPAPGATPG